jgi:NAD(P)-dependent dehydrogenase (short-subunit alcohol dehydrogenase family)
MGTESYEHRTNGLAGKVGIVTGAGTGIGLEVTRQLTFEGVRVCGFCVVAEQREAFEEAAGEAGLFKVVDVADPAAVESAVAEVAAEAGRIDVLVNNAGVRDIGSALDVPLEDWQRVIDVNVNGTFYCSRFVAKVMVEQSDGGSIVNMGSLASRFGHGRRTAYTTSKHAVLGLTRVFAAEFGSAGIRVNAVMPGLIETPMTRNYVHDPVVTKNMKGLVPLGRPGRPIDIAAAVVFLAGDLAGFVSGVGLPVDGGFDATATFDPAGESQTFTATQAVIQPPA